MIMFEVLQETLQFQLVYTGLKRAALDVAGGEVGCVVAGNMVQAPAQTHH